MQANFKINVYFNYILSCMSKNLSAVKKVQIASRNRLRNKKYKFFIKKSIKKYLLDIKNTNIDTINFNNNNLNNLSIVYQKIDKAIKRKVLHKNQGARKKARLAQIMKSQLRS